MARQPMSQENEAFEAWWTIEHQKVFGRSVTDIAESAWNACLAAHADALELARRVEALPYDGMLEKWHGGKYRFSRPAYDGPKREGVCVLRDCVYGETPLEALRTAGIGGE